MTEPKTFANFQEVLDFLIETNAEIRGEALAARVLVSYAVAGMVGNTSDKERALNELFAKAKETIETATPTGEGNARLVGIQKARALRRIEETVEEVRRILELRRTGLQ